MHRPPTLCDRPEATPATERVVSFRARLLRPAGRHAMVVAHFFESGAATPSTWGESRAHSLWPAQVALASTGYISCDRRKGLGGATSARPGVQGSPQREPALPTETAREQSTRGASESSFWSGGWIAGSVAGRRGQAVVRRKRYP